MVTFRNTALGRSMLFSTLAKLSGAAIPFAGLPIIAHSLPASAYATFLKAMTIASLSTSFFGAASIVAIRDIARARASGSKAAVGDAESSTLGLYIVVSTVSIITAAVLLMGQARGTAVLMAIASIIVVTQGLAQWGDAHRVGSRTDHISSLWQLSSSLALISAIVSARPRNPLGAILIYFGIPAIFQVLMAAQLILRDQLRTRPTFNLAWAILQLRGIAPVLVNFATEYIKIFGSGTLILFVSGRASYSMFLTLILLGARLVNPISLIARPLMPAYVDAVAANDQQWLSGMVKILSIMLFCGAIVALTVYGVLQPSTLDVFLPPTAPRPSFIDIGFLMLFIWGHAGTALLAPIFFAGGKAALFSTINLVLVCVGLSFGNLLFDAGMPWGILAGLSVGTSCVALFAWAFTVAHRGRFPEGKLIQAAASRSAF